jgi:hypothetical protein
VGKQARRRKNSQYDAEQPEMKQKHATAAAAQRSACCGSHPLRIIKNLELCV